MGISAKSKITPFNPKGLYQVSENFSDGIYASKDEFVNLLRDLNVHYINLYKDFYYASLNYNEPLQSKHIKGIYNSGRLGDLGSNFTKIQIYGNPLLYGTWIFENVMIYGSILRLATGAKLILINSDVYFSSNVSAQPINAENGELILINSRIRYAPIGSAVIQTYIGENLVCVNSDCPAVYVRKQIGSITAINSNLAIDNTYDATDYSINLKNSSIYGLLKGNYKVDISNSYVFVSEGRALGNISGKIKNSYIKFNLLFHSNSTNVNLFIINSTIERLTEGTWNGLINFSSIPTSANIKVYVINSKIINRYTTNSLRQKILSLGSSNNVKVYFLNCTFLSNSERFNRFDSIGTNNKITTINCAGNKNPALDTGWNIGEIEDVGFNFDPNLVF